MNCEKKTVDFDFLEITDFTYNWSVHKYKSQKNTDPDYDGTATEQWDISPVVKQNGLF